MPAMHYDRCPFGDVIKSGGASFKIITLTPQVDTEKNVR